MAEIAVGAAIGAALGAGGGAAMGGGDRIWQGALLGGVLGGAGGYVAGPETMFGSAGTELTWGTGQVTTQGATSGLFGSGGAIGAGGALTGTAGMAGLSMLGSMASSFGGYSSGMSRSGYDDYNAQVASNNAALARGTASYNASVIETQRLQDRRVADSQFKKDQARREVLMGKGGVDTGSGSPLEVLAGAEADHEFNLLTIDFTRGLQKDQVLFQGDQQAYNYDAQSSLLSTRSGDESSSALWGMGGGLLSGGAKAYQIYKGKTA